MPDFENEIQHQPDAAPDAGAKELAQEAVKDAFTKSATEIAAQPSGSPSDTTSKVLPGLEIIHGERAPEGVEPAPGKNEMYMNGRLGAKDNSDAFNQLEELKKDPQGDGGGEATPLPSAQSGGGARKGGGKFEEGTSQSGKGTSGAGSEAANPILTEPKSGLKEIGTKIGESAESAAPKETTPKAPKSEVKNAPSRPN